MKPINPVDLLDAPIMNSTHWIKQVRTSHQPKVIFFFLKGPKVILGIREWLYAIIS